MRTTCFAAGLISALASLHPMLSITTAWQSEDSSPNGFPQVYGSTVPPDFENEDKFKEKIIRKAQNFLSDPLAKFYILKLIICLISNLINFVNAAWALYLCHRDLYFLLLNGTVKTKVRRKGPKLLTKDFNSALFSDIYETLHWFAHRCVPIVSMKRNTKVLKGQAGQHTRLWTKMGFDSWVTEIE